MKNKSMRSVRTAYLLTVMLLPGIVAFSQSAGLKPGDVPSPLILPSSHNTVDAIGFPYKNQLLYMRFWSSDSAASSSDFNRLKWLYKHHLREDFNVISGFDVLLIALSSDREKWEQELSNLKVTSLKNYIALKGADDYYLRQFRISAVPYSLLINEKGQIQAMNPSLSDVDQAIGKYKKSSARPAENIAGMLSQGDTIETRVSNQTVYVTNSKNDTIQRVRTNSEGVFVIPNVKSEERLTLNVGNSDQLDSGKDLHLADAEGNIIDDFDHTPFGYNITISRREIDGMVYPFEVKSLFYSENLFKSGQNSLSEDARQKLNRIAGIMKADSLLSIEILSHTDCSGNATSNMALSVLRANLCATYIYGQGIPKSRIRTVGHGETMPLNRCIDGVSCTPQELEVNRRVEFRFYKTLPK